MKHEKQNERLACDQQAQGIENIHVVNVKINNRANTSPEIFVTQLPSYAVNLGSKGGDNTIRGHHIGKAPPGRPRAPGAARGHPPATQQRRPSQKADRPENKAGSPTQQTKICNTNHLIFNTEKTIHFINILNFKNMKKQILILAVFVLAMIASVTDSYGQASELAPAPGVAYDYSVAVAGAGSNPKYTFFVTKNTDILVGELAPEAVGVDFGVNAIVGAALYNTAGASNHINLTWTIASLASATPFFLVVKYTEVLNGCTTTNKKVWQIKPVNSFVLAIVPSSSAGVTIVGAATQCVADITSMVVTPDITAPMNPTVAFTYGHNILYFKATASGMVGSWRPDIQLTSVVAGADNQVYTSAQWTTDMTGAGGWKTFTGAATSTPGIATGFPSADVDLAPITLAGADILIKIDINNVNFETITGDQAITAGIDGYISPLLTQSDAISLSDPTLEAAYGKKAVYTITKRPTVTSTVPFITKVP